MGMLRKLAYGLAVAGFMAGTMMLSQNPELQAQARNAAHFMRANPWQATSTQSPPPLVLDARRHARAAAHWILPRPSLTQSIPTLQGALLHCALSVSITASGIPFALVDLAAGAVYPLHLAIPMLFIAKTLGIGSPSAALPTPFCGQCPPLDLPHAPVKRGDGCQLKPLGCATTCLSGSTACYLVANNVLPASAKASLVSHPTIGRINKLLAGRPLYYGASPNS